MVCDGLGIGNQGGWGSSVSARIEIEHTSLALAFAQGVCFVCRNLTILARRRLASLHCVRDASHHPDLNIEVETLSNKLISAINHQTHLDDALTATRAELEAAQEKALRLDAQNREHKMLIANGDLVKKSDLDSLRTQLAEERKRRQQTEKEKKSIETELENLSAALFEEANQVSILSYLISSYLTYSRWSPMLVKRQKLQKRRTNSSDSKFAILKCFYTNVLCLQYL